MARPIIALLTDFGTADAYVAAMKGVILGISPEATIVDITHDVTPQGVAQAAFLLHTAYPFFRSDTIYVAVVDPGVGTQRRAILVQTPHGRFLAPDNGILTYVVRDHLQDLPTADRPLATVQVPLPTGWTGVALTSSRYWRHPVSATFHGRDVFAPVAAHLAQGAPMSDLGEEVSWLTILHVPQPVREGAVLKGIILHADRFGNLVTNIPGEMVEGERLQVQVGSAIINGLSATYWEGEGLVALIGSHGNLEIAQVGGSAGGYWELGWGRRSGWWFLESPQG